MGAPVDLAERVLADPSTARRRVDGVWLFGSFARGEERPGSDIDVAILCDPPLGLERAAMMERLARALGREVDVIDLATAAPSLAWEVVTQGRILVALDRAAVDDFTLRARWAADDDAHRSRLILQAQTGRLPGARR